MAQGNLKLKASGPKKVVKKLLTPKKATPKIIKPKKAPAKQHKKLTKVQQGQGKGKGWKKIENVSQSQIA